MDTGICLHFCNEKDILKAIDGRLFNGAAAAGFDPGL